MFGELTSELWIPYGETEIPIRVPDDNFYKILEPKKPAGSPQLSTLVEAALSHPVEGIALSSLAKPGASAGFLIDPIVPAAVQHEAIGILVAKLKELGVSEIKFFARDRTSNVGPISPLDGHSVKRVDPNSKEFGELGKTVLGTTVTLETELLACDIKITIGLVMPHFANGFTGGPDLILPGASSFETISKNRSLMVRGVSRPGSPEENPVLSDALEAYKMSGPFFSLTMVPDGWDGIDSVYAGELESAYREATSRYLQIHNPKLDRKAEIVVVAAGKMLGMDLYHGVRVLSNAFGAVKKDGTIVLVAECSNGIGDQAFLEASKRFSDKKELVVELRRNFKLGNHVSLFLKDALEKHRVQLVSVLPDLYARDSFSLKPSRTASSAIQQAIRVEGKEAKILLVTRGDLTIPTMATSENTVDQVQN